MDGSQAQPFNYEDNHGLTLSMTFGNAFRGIGSARTRLTILGLKSRISQSSGCGELAYSTDRVDVKEEAAAASAAALARPMKRNPE